LRVAEANNLVIKMYVKNDSSKSGDRKSDHDLATVTVNYSS